MGGILTGLIQHLVALVEDEHLEVVELEILSVYQGQDSAWGSNHDVGGLLRVLQQLNVIIDWNTAVEGSTSDLLEVLGESVELLLDLIRQLSGVAQDQGRSWLWVGLIDLVQDRKDEDSGLTHARHGLAEDVFARDSGWDALLLDLRRMLEPALSDGSRKFTLEEEVSEGGSVHSSVSGDPKQARIIRGLYLLVSGGVIIASRVAVKASLTELVILIVWWDHIFIVINKINSVFVIHFL